MRLEQMPLGWSYPSFQMRSQSRSRSRNQSQPEPEPGAGARTGARTNGAIAGTVGSEVDSVVVRDERPIGIVHVNRVEIADAVTNTCRFKTSLQTKIQKFSGNGGSLIPEIVFEPDDTGSHFVGGDNGKIGLEPVDNKVGSDTVVFGNLPVVRVFVPDDNLQSEYTANSTYTVIDITVWRAHIRRHNTGDIVDGLARPQEFGNDLFVCQAGQRWVTVGVDTVKDKSTR